MISPERCRSEESVGKCGRLDSKAASVFDARSSDLAFNTGTFTWAIAFLEKDVAGNSFQQSGVGSDIRKVNMNSNRISDCDHPTFLSSLSGDIARDTHLRVTKLLALRNS